MFSRPRFLATFAALMGAVIWSVGIGFTIAAYNQQNATGYALHNHFISELGMPATSRLTWLFNLTEAVGCLVSLPIVYALATHLRSRLGTVAARFAAVAFLAGSGIGLLGLRLDVLRPEHITLTFLSLHLGGAAICFGCWAVAVTLFTAAVMHRRTDASARGLVVTGIICTVVAVLLFGTGAFAVRQLAMQSVEREPVFRAIFHSHATPQMFNAWLESHREVFGAFSAMEWSLLGTILLWHGMVVGFLWLQPKSPALAKDDEQIRASATPGDRSVKFAHGISIVGHPFTFIVVLLLVPFLRRGQLNSLRVAGVVAIAALVPLGLFMRQRFRSGRWQTVDASARRDRPVAYVAVFVALVPVLIYFSAVEHSPALVRGGLVIGAMMAVGAGLNRWIKGSGHMAFAALSAVVLARLSLGYSIAIALFIPWLAWSRLKLQRHTLIEVMGGGVLGLLAGGAMLAV